MTNTEIKVERTDMGTVHVGDEAFNLVKDEDMFLLSHPTWSLTGRGYSIEEAAQDVRYTAHILLPVYAERYPEGLSEAAEKMVDYMLEIFEPSEDENGNCQCFHCCRLRDRN